MLVCVRTMDHVYIVCMCTWSQEATEERIQAGRKACARGARDCVCPPAARCISLINRDDEPVCSLLIRIIFPCFFALVAALALSFLFLSHYARVRPCERCRVPFSRGAEPEAALAHLSLVPQHLQLLPTIASICSPRFSRVCAQSDDKTANISFHAFERRPATVL